MQANNTYVFLAFQGRHDKRCWRDAVLCTQANNAYVFPAVGFAAVLTRASSISDDVFLAAAEALAQMTTLQVSLALLPPSWLGEPCADHADSARNRAGLWSVRT